MLQRAEDSTGYRHTDRNCVQEMKTGSKRLAKACEQSMLVQLETNKQQQSLCCCCHPRCSGCKLGYATAWGPTCLPVL